LAACFDTTVGPLEYFDPTGIRCLRLPARSPNLNAFSERWVRSVKEEFLSRLILFGERSLHLAVTEFVCHFPFERNHQGKENALLFPAACYAYDAPARPLPTAPSWPASIPLPSRMNI
jgi:hypothetical protein